MARCLMAKKRKKEKKKRKKEKEKKKKKKRKEYVLRKNENAGVTVNKIINPTNISDKRYVFFIKKR